MSDSLKNQNPQPSATQSSSVQPDSSHSSLISPGFEQTGPDKSPLAYPDSSGLLELEEQAGSADSASSAGSEGLTELAGHLQRTAASLLTLAAAGAPNMARAGQKLPETEKHTAARRHPDSAQSPAKAASQAQNSDQAQIYGKSTEASQVLRCYSYPAFMLEDERAILAAHKAKSLTALLDDIRGELHLTAYLMENFDPDEEVEGFILQQLGRRLQAALDTLGDACSFFSSFTPARSSPAQGLKGLNQA